MTQWVLQVAIHGNQTVIDKLFLNIWFDLIRSAQCPATVTFPKWPLTFIAERPSRFDQFHESPTTDGGRWCYPRRQYSYRDTPIIKLNAKVIDNGAQPEIADGALCLAVYRIYGRWMVVSEAGSSVGVKSFGGDGGINIRNFQIHAKDLHLHRIVIPSSKKEIIDLSNLIVIE